MRTAVLTVAHEDGAGAPWTETYMENESGQRGLKSTTTDVDAWARGLIEYFNETITDPRRERRRVLVSVSVTDDGKGVKPGEHEWHKTNAITISDRVGVYDAMRCELCGVTGKRFGLGRVKIDSKFRAKKYQTCSGSVK